MDDPVKPLSESSDKPSQVRPQTLGTCLRLHLMIIPKSSHFRAQLDPKELQGYREKLVKW